MCLILVFYTPPRHKLAFIRISKTVERFQQGSHLGGDM